MREDLKHLCEKLAVGYTLSAYETCPWSAYDPERGITASAEVRMNNEGSELEAEIQFLYDAPETGQPPVQQMCWMFCKPVVQDKWSPVKLIVKGTDETNCVYEWEEKACSFFTACVQDIRMGQIPDIDELMARELKGGERFRDGRQGGGSKAPKIKPQALLGIKGGRGF